MTRISHCTTVYEQTGGRGFLILKKWLRRQLTVKKTIVCLYARNDMKGYINVLFMVCCGFE